jgi:hypothetical protein
MLVFKAALYYFCLVFSVGFVLGVFRTLLLVPHLGTRWAELSELPLMVTVSFLAARRTVRKFRIPSRLAPRAALGIIALTLIVFVELGLVLQLQGLSLAEYIAQRDPISGPAYYLSLLLFALFPLVA